MNNIGNDVKYYSVFCPDYDTDTGNLDMLTKVRFEFFKNRKRQKNKLVDEIDNKTYRYSYFFEDGKPAKWKKMVNDILLEQSKVNPDNSYEITVKDENKNLVKIMYFNPDHSWQKSEYFKERSKISFSRCINEDKILVSKHNGNEGGVVCYDIFPFYIKPDEYEIDALNSKITSLLCTTSNGNVSYFTKEQLESLKRLRKEKNIVLLATKKEVANKNEKPRVQKNIELDGEKLLDDNINSLEQNEGPVIEEVLQVVEEKELPDNNCSFLCYPSECSCPFSKSYGKTIKTDVGETYFYFGDIEKKSRHGYGKTVTSEGKTTFEGNYINDKKDGFGAFYNGFGKLSYAGNFKEDKKNDLGITFSNDNKTIHVGAWDEDKPKKAVSVFDKKGNLLFAGNSENGLKTGAGFSYEAKTGAVFVGCYDNGKYTGKGTLFDSAGQLFYTGDVESGVRQGFGTEYNRDGTLKYRGNWKNDIYNGQGCLYFEDGRKIEGAFEDGKVEGFACEYDCRGKKIYEGNWKNNLYNEEGTKYLNNGNYLKGLFESGQAQGVLLEFNADGEVVYKGNFDDDTYCGEGSLYVDGMKLYEGSFENNAYNGFGKLYENMFCVYEGQFSNGLRSGFGTSYRDDEIIYIGNWFENKYDGIGIIYEQAKPKYTGSFLKGKKHGRVNEIFEGKVVKECIFESDNLVYLKEYKYPNMNMVYDGNIHNGKKCGMGCTFTEYGEKEQEGIFANDEIVTRMRVYLKEITPLPECELLNSTEYNKFRTGPLVAVEKELLGGIYSGFLKDDKPDGKGTILYSDHRYTGDFLNGVPKGVGTIYKNDGTQICGKFFEGEVLGSTIINFDSGITYNFMSEI